MADAPNAPAPSPPAPPRPPRTPADAVVEVTSSVLTALGAYAPFVVLVVSLAGVYYFVTNQYEKSLNATQDQIRRNYTTLGELGSKQLQQVSASLKLNEDSIKFFDTLRKEREASEKALKARHNTIETLQQNLLKRQNELVKKERMADESEAEVMRLRTMNKTLNEMIAQSQAATNQVGQTNISQLRDLRKAAQALRDNKQDDLKRLLAPYMQANANEAKSRLRKHAEVLDADSARALNSLAGLKVDELEKLLAEDLGFATWIKFSGASDQNFYVGAVKQTQTAYEGLVVVKTTDLRVLEVETSDWVRLVKTVDERDLSGTKFYLARLQAQFLWDRERSPPVGTTWSLADSSLGLFNATLRPGTLPPSKGRVLFSGENLPKTIPSVSGLSFLEAHSALIRANRYGLSAAVDREKRRKSFSAASLVGNLPSEFRATVMEALEACVRPDEQDAQSRFGPQLTPSNRGQLGAAALRPDFKITTTKQPDDTTFEAQAECGESQQREWLRIVFKKTGAAWVLTEVKHYRESFRAPR